jgi:hypothetical protein
MMETTELYSAEDLLDPAMLSGKLKDEAFAIVVEALASIVYKEMLAQAANQAWQLSQHSSNSFNRESAFEELFGGEVSTAEEQSEISERLEQYRHSYAELSRQAKSVKAPEVPGLVKYLQSLLLRNGDTAGKS